MSYQTEEEQVQAIKNWWAENGRSIVLGVGLALVMIFGWRWWQSSQQENQEMASDRYQQLLEAFINGVDDERNAATAIFLGDELKDNFGGTEYASFAALLMARMAVEQGDLEGAETELAWVIEHSRSDNLKQIAQLRQARVIGALGRQEEALAIIETTEPHSDASWEEVRGDLLVSLGRLDEARTAYANALAVTPPGQVRPYLEMKVADLTGPEEN